MDHLPRPRFPKYSPIEVPYLCIEEYDGGPLETYPQRKGWSNLANPETTLSYLQTWLFFGLLNTVFGDKINTTTFTRHVQDPSRKVIDTSTLPEITSNWIKAERALEQTTKNNRRKRTTDAIVFVARCMKAIYHAGDNPLALRIIFSIELLSEFLQSASFRAYDSNTSFDWRYG